MTRGGVFIYPGSSRRLKAVLLEQMRPLLEAASGATFHEVFAGSAVMTMALSAIYPSMSFHLNDLDPYMYAFWDLVARGTRADDAKMEALLSVPPTPALFQRLRALQRAPSRLSRLERAYHAVFFHRCTFSGIFFGAIKGGLEQLRARVTDRYVPERVVAAYKSTVAALRGRLTVTNLDASTCVRSCARRPNDVWFLDPPYIERGEGWYSVWMTVAAHRALASALRSGALPRRRWLMTIGDDPQLAELYAGLRHRKVRVYRTAGHGLHAQAVQVDVLVDDLT